MEAPLDNERHLRYWKRCLRSLLPHPYTSNDSIRMTLGCFIIAAIDLLTPTSAEPPEPKNKPLVAPTDKALLRGWVLSCQHPGGGFAGSPTHSLPADEYQGYNFETQREEVAAPSAANVAATYFALQLLALLAEDGTADSAFAGVHRRATLAWLRKLQRDDGSFGEVLVDIPGHGKECKRTISGGRDMRYCYIAAMIRWTLRGAVEPGHAAWVEDIDVEGLVRHIKNGQTYDGGFSEDSMHESHAGYTFCAVAALSLLDRPQSTSSSSCRSPSLQRGISDLPALTKWLASRPFVYLGHDDDEGDDAENFVQPLTLSTLTLSDNPAAHIGFNGRCNKVADTCYCWWVGGALSILGRLDQIPREASRRFLLEKTQHLIGGFAKHPGDPPDLYHAYLGLAALATMREPGLKGFDAALCISTETVRKIEAGRSGLLKAAEVGGSRDADRMLRVGMEILGRKVEWLSAES